MATERTELRRLLGMLADAGYSCREVGTEGEQENCASDAEVIAAVFSVGLSWLHFRRDHSVNASHEDKRSRTIMIVLGNATDGSELCADWSTRDEAFGNVLDRFVDTHPDGM